MAASARQAAWALAPAFAVLLAFWLLPLAHLVLLGAQSRDSNGSGYWQNASSTAKAGASAQAACFADAATYLTSFK